ncbi:MAG: DNA polymerase/3'-5' exonuclease PolX [Methanoregulaceae archaeon]|jgi:DNA polymerase (family 10)|nr:DNA polymerase/3'-5' exonuclease PolX [Methanoregulaceae archaeon]MCU0627952.1 DNA polymerase/3'-5' exonuclease PolX [Methanoregulaceae archaeon]
MEVTNQQVAAQLNLMGQILEIKGENVFKIRAFYRASDIIDRLAAPVAGMDDHALSSIDGIGKNIARKIREIVEKGTFTELEEAKSGIPGTLIELLNLEGVGPKTVSTLWKKLNVLCIDDLERAAKGHRIRAIRGFGEKKEEGFLKSIAIYRDQSGRMNRLEADAVAGKIRPILDPGTYEFAGSYRRGKSSIGDIDVVTIELPGRLNPKLRTIAEEVIDAGDRKTSLRILGKRVDFRFTRSQQFGSMLLYLTGSKAFNIKLREIAMSRGYKLNEYGIEDRSTGTHKEFSREDEILAFLGLDYIVPELREDWGEVERALSHSLPVLVDSRDIRGDLHVHSSWTDGLLSLKALAKAGEDLGYEYIVCSDHSATLGIAHGLDEGGLTKQAHEIEMINRSSSCRIIHGIEVDILADGSLGLPNRALSDLEIVIASVHSGFSQPRDIMTRRILAAVEHDHVDIIGHPTGRLIGKRQGYSVDISRLIERARETGTSLECNASPFRLDLDDTYIREAVEKGVRIAIGTDTHDSPEFLHMQYGVMTCRRGWCSRKNVLNTLSTGELLEWAA